MAFGDWDFYTTGGLNASLEIGNPIVGSGSLACGNRDAGTFTAGAVVTHLDSGFNQGLEKGRIRTLFRFNADTSTSIHTSVGGYVYFMSSALDITTGTPDFYVAGLSLSYDTSEEVKPIIGKASSDSITTARFGVNGGSGTDLYTSTATDIALLEDQPIPFQVEWNLDIAQLGGLRITVSVGNAGDTDFSNLATVYDLVDPTPHTNAVGEGLAMQYVVASSAFYIALGEYFAFDQTGVFQLV